ncbi:putative hydrolase YdeN [compost metagenome]
MEESVVKRSFLILYGLGGSGPDHWQSWLARGLSARGETVHYPSLPNPDHPDKNQWLDSLAQSIGAIPADEELTVVAHSLACILWFHHAAQGVQRKAERVFLVAPPSVHTKLDEVASFFPVPDRLEEVQHAAAQTLLIQSSTDPYCTLEDSLVYQRMGVPSLTLPDMGHINIASGYGPWEWILKLCLNGSPIL